MASELERRQLYTPSLEAFLYILLRDYITLGQCEELMRTAKVAAENGATFSNEHLRNYLAEIIARLK